MKPYESNLEYIGDLRRLTELKISLFEKKFDKEHIYIIKKHRSEIKERAILTKEIFIPVEYVINVFFLNELEEHFFYTLFLYEVDKECRNKIAKIDGLESLNVKSFGALINIMGGDDCHKGLPYSEFLDNFIIYDDVGGFTLRNEILRFIFNTERWNEKLWMELFTPDIYDGSLLFEKKTISAISALIESCINITSERSNIISVFGRVGSGRRSLVRRAAYENNLTVLFIDCKRLPDKNDFKSIADEIRVMALLEGAALCLYNTETLIKDENKLSCILWGIRRISRLVFVITEESGLDLYAYKYTVLEYGVPPLDMEISMRLWEHETKKYKLSNDVDFIKIITAFKLTPLQIKQAADGAYVNSIIKGLDTVDLLELTASCQAVSTKNISSMGKFINPTFQWDDLVLAEEQKAMLSDAINRVRFFNKVYIEWGFEKKVPYGFGLHILLSGLPGTGKTMIAQILARELCMPIYKIDLSAVMSKYIGETEKSLCKVFDEGKNTNSILFFDEADSLFGKRTEIKDSHDRHANLQVSFLLQKIEEHSGVVILATNLVKNFDDAFKRRFHYIINISMPDAKHRKEMWGKVFPKGAPLDSDIDFEYLAQKFDLSGSNIKNIALSSAFYAAADNKAIGMKEIIKALKNEIVKTGGLIIIDDIED